MLTLTTALLLSLTPIQLPTPPTPAPIELASGGCGPGGHRDAYGYCRPNARPIYRRCPYRYHPTPYGCRPNF